MIVVDASAALSALLNAGPARLALRDEQLHVPHLIDSEVVSGLRRQVIAGELEAEVAWTLLNTWRQLGMTRYPTYPLMDRIWALRDNVTTYDASYVALAERLECALLTADGRIGRAAGIRCSVTVVPR